LRSWNTSGGFGPDPFDRMLVAQASVEGLTLLNFDPAIAKYPGPTRLA
jgi:PIN domain nuclease of toxin-antitoxin system